LSAVSLSLSGCVPEEVWLNCDDKEISSLDEDVESEKDKWRSPYWPALEPLCIGSPPSGALRIAESIRFNWRHEDSVRLTKVVISDEPLKLKAASSSNGGPIENVESIQAVWDSSLDGVPGFLALNSLRNAVLGEPGSLAADEVLVNDKDYYWSVWGYDAYGSLGYASEERSFRLSTVESIR
jgi:hypothetical protein